MYRPGSDGIFPRMRRIPMLLCVVALPPIFLLVGCGGGASPGAPQGHPAPPPSANVVLDLHPAGGSGEHTSEIQSPPKLVCRLLLLKKKKRQSVVCLD